MLGLVVLLLGVVALLDAVGGLPHDVLQVGALLRLAPRVLAQRDAVAQSALKRYKTMNLAKKSRFSSFHLGSIRAGHMRSESTRLIL